MRERRRNDEKNEVADKEGCSRPPPVQTGDELERDFNSTSFLLGCCAGAVAGYAAGNWIQVTFAGAHYDDERWTVATFNKVFPLCLPA